MEAPHPESSSRALLVESLGFIPTAAGHQPAKTRRFRFSSLATRTSVQSFSISSMVRIMTTLCQSSGASKRLPNLRGKGRGVRGRWPGLRCHATEARNRPPEPAGEGAAASGGAGQVSRRHGGTEPGCGGAGRPPPPTARPGLHRPPEPSHGQAAPRAAGPPGSRCDPPRAQGRGPVGVDLLPSPPHPRSGQLTVALLRRPSRHQVRSPGAGTPASPGLVPESGDRWQPWPLAVGSGVCRPARPPV